MWMNQSKATNLTETSAIPRALSRVVSIPTLEGLILFFRKSTSVQLGLFSHESEHGVSENETE